MVFFYCVSFLVIQVGMILEVGLKWYFVKCEVLVEGFRFSLMVCVLKWFVLVMKLVVG